MQTLTTSKGLQERQDIPQVLTSSEESFNSKSLKNADNSDSSKPSAHLGCGYNSQTRASISGHTVFVLGVDGKSLTPTTNAKARKLLEGNQAKPIWNRFSMFGLQMLADAGKATPKTAFGIDFGTKFEGYAMAVGNENNLSVMLRLPDKKKIMRKLTERRQMRRARRFRNCRRRACRFDNRERKGFIAPSQLAVVNSRLKVIFEFFRCYPVTAVAMENVRFNHARFRWGRNFSTIEIGKKKIYDWIRSKSFLSQYGGYDTQSFREKYDYHKSSVKNANIFDSHCSDALAIATDLFCKKHIERGMFMVIDDTYRPERRKLYDFQFSKGGVRHKYSSGNFKQIRKGTICEFGQICGGTKGSAFIRNNDGKRISKSLQKIDWMSHKFQRILSIPPMPEDMGILERRF